MKNFFLLLLHAHVVYAAETVRKTATTANVTELAKLVIEKFTQFSRANESAPGSYEDGVFLYASEVLSLGLIWHGFHDPVQEANGDRILWYWESLLVIFKTTNHYNYGKEAISLLYQCYCNRSEREKTQLIWNRCVIAKGQSHNYVCFYLQ